MKKTAALALLAALTLGGCGQAASPLAARPASAVRAAAVRVAATDSPVVKAWFGFQCTVFTLADGGRITVDSGDRWPFAFTVESKPGTPAKNAQIDDAAVPAMIARLKAVKPAPGIEKPALAAAIRALEIAPTVMDGRWDGVTISRIRRDAKREAFSVTIEKGGFSLDLAITRLTGRTYLNTFSHYTHVRMEGRNFGTDEAAAILKGATLRAGAPAALREAAIALTLKPGTQTAGEEE